jgi:hypothetical protein
MPTLSRFMRFQASAHRPGDAMGWVLGVLVRTALMVVFL